MSTSLIDEVEPRASGPEIVVVAAEGFPPPRHETEAGCFARHEGIPGHAQGALESARICMVGAGGLGGWAALALARSGARSMTIVEPDRFERSNASRQLMFSCDVGAPKAFAVARNLAPHMIAGGEITAIGLPFALARQRYALGADVIVCLVDNNACRLEAVQFAAARRIPAVFAMLSLDSMRLHVFLQSPGQACLWCALPNLDPASSAPCAAATIVSCLLAASHASFFVHRALMGWPADAKPLNWREVDLLGESPDRHGMVTPRPDCQICGGREWSLAPF
jgi:molybdopterin-synthase adenylyltransferase